MSRRGQFASTVAFVFLLTLRAAGAAAQEGEDKSALLSFFTGTALSGYVDTYYSFNFNTPSKPCAVLGDVPVQNCLRSFDVAYNSFTLNMAEIAIAKTPRADSRAGFRVNLAYGPESAILTSAEPGGADMLEHVQEAFVSVLAPISSKGVQLDFGKFPAVTGIDVAETPLNWNYSRSLLFGLATPYYHMGLRAAYSPRDNVRVTGFLVNGWNNVVDNNDGKTVGFLVSAKPSGRVAIEQSYLGGPETSDSSEGWRHLADTVVALHAGRRSEVALNYAIGKDRNSSQMWQGGAGSLKFALGDSVSVVPRYEFVRDRDGFMTGVSQNVQEATLTVQFKQESGLLIRVECRADRASKPFFLMDASRTVRAQPTVVVGLVYPFGWQPFRN